MLDCTVPYEHYDNFDDSYDFTFKKNYYIYNIKLLFDILNSEKKEILYSTRKCLYNSKEKNNFGKIDFANHDNIIHSFDANIINDNIIYINIYYSDNPQGNELLNEFVIYNIF